MSKKAEDKVNELVESKDSQPEVGEMKKGDYMIHVFVQNGKQLKQSGGGSDLVTPMIEITCCGKKKYTSSKSDVAPTSSVYWGEHVFFEASNMSKHEIENSQIQIRVLNKHILKDDIIGLYDFDVTFVYFQPQHALFHQWVALSNPESKEFNEISGYLKLSISVQGPGDEQITLNETVGLDQAAGEQETMMPASIKRSFKQVKFRFLRGEKLPKMDKLGTIDAYITTSFGKKRLQTKPVTQSKTTNETAIEQEIWLPIQWPMATDRLIMKVYDYNDMLSDEIVGSMNFSFKNIVNQTETDQLNLVWRNLYGSPLGCSGQNTKLMNDNPEIASNWKGRILMNITSFDVKNPEMKDKLAITQEMMKQATVMGAFEQNEFEIIADISTGISLPGKSKYKIRIAINDFMIDSAEPKEVKDKYCRWCQRIEQTTFKGPYKSVEELDRIYIYLLDGSDEVCFWQGQASDFTDPNPKLKWIQLTCNLAKGKVTKPYEAGVISLKLSINHKTKNGPIDFKKYDAWKKPLPKRLNSWKIRCYIFQCKDLPSADSDGSSDPYIQIWNPDGKALKTQVVEDNLNPIFFEVLEVFYDFESIDDAPPILFDIWDVDAEFLDRTDDYLGRCQVYLKDAAISNNNTIPVPKWHDVKMGGSKNDPVAGQLLVSFSAVELDFTFKIPINYIKLTEEIEYKDYDVEINILGLRELESFGLMPVKKPFIKFNLRSLLPPEKAQAITNVKTQPSATGKNPNLNTIINFAIDLPVDPLFCPKLSCEVYDYVYKGLMQPLLGTFTIAIGEIMQKAKDKKHQELETSDKIIQQIKDQIQIASQFSPDENRESSNIAFQRRATNLNKMIEGQTEIDSSRVFRSVGEKQKLIMSEGPVGNFQDIEATQGDDENSLMNPTRQIAIEGVDTDLEESKEMPSFLSGLGVKPQKALKKSPTRNVFTSKEPNMQEKLGEAVNVKIFFERELQKQADKIRLETQRIVDKVQMKEDGHESHKNVILPRYIFDDRLKIQREISKPPASLYMELGFNRQQPTESAQDQKHYRRFYVNELENVKEVFPKMPFHTVEITRGQQRGLSKGWFDIFSKSATDDSGEISNVKTVGKFKGRVSIVNKSEKLGHKDAKDDKTKLIIGLIEQLHMMKYGVAPDFKLADLESFESSLKIENMLDDLGLDGCGMISYMKEQSYAEMITRQLLQKTKCMIRLYVLEGFDFAQRDIGSFSDPYLKIRCGTNRYNERENYQLDEKDPKFYKMYQFDADFPGAAPITIKAYDYDDLFGDDLIGKTTIDLDDRFFCPQWQQIEEKPIEFRQLYHPASSISQGVIKLWVEIHMTNSSTKSASTVWDVKPQPTEDYEVRLVVWDTKDVIMADAEGTSDVFMKAFIDDKDKKETDTHYRCQNGKASFNYRLLYNVKAPRANYDLTFQVWDRDLFKKNDFIGEVQFTLRHLFEDAMATQKAISLNKKYYNQYLKEKLGSSLEVEFYDEDSFYVTTKNSEGELAGKVRISLSVNPGAIATSNPVGTGRSEPNHSPFLPPPVGRISFSLNPFTMFNQMVGPELRRKVYAYLCLALCVLACVAMLPMIMGDLISALILKVI